MQKDPPEACRGRSERGKKPLVANQWWNPERSHTGYHGYWASDFASVDAHYGDLDDCRRLADGLHRRGMHLVQDIVVNHVGDWFGYDGRWTAGNAPRGYTRLVDGGPVQPPFDLNDPRDPAQRTAGIYHWTPAIADYSDPLQETDWQMGGLDDLNTENPRVRRARRQACAHWIEAVGVAFARGRPTDGPRIMDDAWLVLPVAR